MRSILDILDDMVISGIDSAGDYIIICGCEDRGCCDCGLWETIKTQLEKEN